MNSDIHFMKRAIRLALKAEGQTSPNPIVGCVIVKAGKVVGEGWHKVCGGAHAEVNALDKAGVKAKGATMYVTLEPCSHWGRTPPCVDAIIASGVKKVVVAMRDPNSVNNGKSLRFLEKRGVKVVAGVCEEDARAINQPFIKLMTKKMPFVVAKIAQTLDGKTAARTGDSKWITSEATRILARKKRNQFDAILVGINTILKDDPELSAPNKRIKKIILDTRLKISATSRIFRETPAGDVVIATTRKASPAKIRRLEKLGVGVVLCPERQGRVDLKWLLKELAKSSIAGILIEGGARVIGSALKEGLVDRLHIYIAPKVMGDCQAQGSVAGFVPLKADQALKFSVRHVEKLNEDIFIEAEI